MPALDIQQGWESRQRSLVRTPDGLPLSRNKDQKADPQQLSNRYQGSVDHLDVGTKDKLVDPQEFNRLFDHHTVII